MSAPTPFANLPRGLAPLGYRDFLLFWIGLTTTLTGRWIELTGVLWLVYELTDSPFLVGVLGAVRAAPSLVLSPLAGVVSDRVSPRLLLAVCQAATMVAAIALGILIVLGTVELWHVYTQVLAQAIIQPFDSAARQILYPRLVPRPLLANAVTLSVTATRMSRFIGPALGGLLIARFGEPAPFLANAICCFGLMFALAAMRPLSRAAGALKTSLHAEFMEGIRYMFADPVLRGLLKLEIVFGFFEMNPTMVAIIGREILEVGPQALGFLLAAPALGSFLGIIWLLAGDQRIQRGRFSIICAFVYGGVLVLVALSQNYWFSFAALATTGLLEVLMTVNRASIVQLATPEQLRGRVLSNMGIVTRGIGPLSETQSGALASLVGPALGISIAAAGVAAAAALTAIYNRALWSFSLPSRE